MIPYSRQSIDAADVEAVAAVLRSSFLTQGPAIEQFEKAIAKKTGSRFAVAFNSGTAALHGAYFAAGVGKGDEVLVPALTFAATGNAALYLGAKPVFVDITEEGLIDVADVRKKIGKRTKVIAPVDYAGRPAPLRELRLLARKHNICLIEDAAHSLGATYRGKPVGSIADMTMFSFHPVKSITTGEGGIIVTNNPQYHRALLLFRSHGITKDPALLTEDHGPWYQEMHALGFNYRMTDISAALGTSQLARLNSFIDARRRAARRYDKLLSGLSEVTLPRAEGRGEKFAWHLYPIRVSAHKRRELFEYLRKSGIGVQVHYLPVYRHPYYRSLGYRKGLCPRAEEWYAREISIPLFPGITEKEQRYVVQKITEILGVKRKK